MDATEFLGHNYSNAEDIIKAGLDNKPTKIEAVPTQEFAKEGKEPERKLSLKLAKLDKPVILNKTNLKIIIAALGSETTNWVGKMVTPIIIPGEMNGQPIKKIVIKV